jgi:hypothetical protein
MKSHETSCPQFANITFFPERGVDELRNRRWVA